MSLFLEAKADLEAPSESGTPLLWAAGSGSCPVVTQLLDAGADPNAQTPEGVSAMLMAAAAGIMLLKRSWRGLCVSQLCSL